MFSGLVRYLQLTAKAKTGLSSTVVIFAIIAALSAVITLGFLLFAAFIWLSERYSALTAALVLMAFFLAVAILAAIGSLVSHRRTIAEAKLALQARSNAPWFDPKMLALGLQVGRSIGLRRIVPMIAVGLLAATLAKEWFGQQGRADDDGGDAGGE